MDPALAHRMHADGLPLRHAGEGVHVVGDATRSLADLARWLNAQGLGGRWRDELLAVTDVHTEQAVAAIERAAVRPLGITTHAVHLVVRTPAGVWVQQRALDKATDPGLWDTTMGGLRAAGEAVHDALARETWEEAGLRTVHLHALQPHGRLTVRRPVPGGYMVEHIDTFAARVPAATSPVNRDGEVAAFDCVAVDDLRRRLQQDRFTLEAALVLLHCLPELR